MKLVVAHDTWVMLLRGVFSLALFLLVNNNSPNYRYKSAEVRMHSWKWWKCLIKYVPETENAITLSTLTAGFLDMLREPHTLRMGTALSCDKWKGGKPLSLVIIIVLKYPSDWWGIKILFSCTCSYGFLQQGRAYFMHTLLINNRRLIILFFEISFMKTWLSFVAWICHLYDSNFYHRSPKNRTGNSSEL